VAKLAEKTAHFDPLTDTPIHLAIGREDVVKNKKAPRKALFY
jgi:hypothetical protein